MATKLGIWVDHREAILVRISDSDVETVHVESDFESQLRRSSDHPTGTFESLQVPADNTRDRKRTADLNQYYDQIISQLGDVESIAIFGPGEARKELNKRMSDTPYAAKVVDVEAADKMTEAQFVAKVRKYFTP